MNDDDAFAGLFDNMDAVALLAGLVLFFIYSPNVRAHGVAEQLWLEVLNPKEVAYLYKVLPAKDFGGVTERPFRRADLVATEPEHACSKVLTNGDEVHGSIAFVVRGGCSFLTKAINVELYGAVAIVIFDMQDDTHAWINMIGDGTNRNNLVGIPAYFLLGIDGHKIRDAITDSRERRAVVNLPVNVTRNAVPHNQPPWDYW